MNYFYHLDDCIFLKPDDFSLTDCHLWEKLLCLSQKCFHAAYEKHNKVCADVMFTVLKKILVCVFYKVAARFVWVIIDLIFDD